MSMITEEHYLIYRERQSRELAEKAKDATIRAIHLEAAKLYQAKLDRTRFCPVR